MCATYMRHVHQHGQGTNKHNFKLKVTDPISYHLGCDFGRNGDATLPFAPRKYVEKIEECYCSMFGYTVSGAVSPILGILAVGEVFRHIFFST